VCVCVCSAGIRFLLSSTVRQYQVAMQDADPVGLTLGRISVQPHWDVSAFSAVYDANAVGRE
jgi:hypothetical protein